MKLPHIFLRKKFKFLNRYERKVQQMKPKEKINTPPRMMGAGNTKTHHKTGYHKPVKNPTTNYPMDSHKDFCRRCLGYNQGFCPITGYKPTNSCSL